MNLELIIKLVKLANNNPNDNEANLAARKVCKIIAEGNYQFNQSQSSNTAKPAADAWKVIFNRFYTGSRGFEGNPWTNPFTRDNKYYKEPINYKPFTEESRKDGFWDIPFTGKTEPDSKIYESYNYESKKERSKTILKCNECGTERETSFQGMPYDFKCYHCHWKYYQSNEENINK